MQKLPENLEVLIELIHYLAAGYKIKDPKDGIVYHVSGLRSKQIKAFLNTPIAKKNGRTPLQCVTEEGRVFLNELKTYINKHS